MEEVLFSKDIRYLVDVYANVAAIILNEKALDEKSIKDVDVIIKDISENINYLKRTEDKHDIIYPDAISICSAAIGAISDSDLSEDSGGRRLFREEMSNLEKQLCYLRKDSKSFYEGENSRELYTFLNMMNDLYFNDEFLNCNYPHV